MSALPLSVLARDADGRVAAALRILSGRFRTDDLAELLLKLGEAAADQAPADILIDGVASIGEGWRRIRSEPAESCAAIRFAGHRRHGNRSRVSLSVERAVATLRRRSSD